MATMVSRNLASTHVLSDVVVSAAIPSCAHIVHSFDKKLATPESVRWGVQGTTWVMDYPNDTHALSHTKLL